MIRKTRKSTSMKIEQFIAQSAGKWRSMRSSHSLAFQHFEEIISTIQITIIPNKDEQVLELLKANLDINLDPISPFKMSWEASSDWEEVDDSSMSSGSSILIPLPTSEDKGLILRSMGYTESTKARSSYQILLDGTLILSTQYEQSIAEERIWFVSTNVRCRSSIVKTSNGIGVLQTSFASEVRLTN